MTANNAPTINLNAVLYKTVFNYLLKTKSEGARSTSLGKLFHNCGPISYKAFLVYTPDKFL